MDEYVQECNTEKWLKQIQEWKEDHPLTMKDRGMMGPLDIIGEINRQFDKAILVTDVGQHQMLVSQYADITENRQLIMSGGLGTMGYGLPGAIGAKIGNPDTPVISVSGDGGMQMNIQEMATAITQGAGVTVCILNNYYLGMVRQMQQLFYGKRYSATCLRRRVSCPSNCKGPNPSCPPYTPDFVKLAESYEALGIRVTKEEEIKAAFEQAKANTKGPTVIEFYIDPTANVFPMVPGGKSLNDMIMDC